MKKTKRLLDAYRFEGFVPLAAVRGVFGDPLARIITLQRRGKKRFVEAVTRNIEFSTTGRRGWYGTNLAGITGYTWKWRYGGFSAKAAAR